LVELLDPIEVNGGEAAYTGKLRPEILAESLDNRTARRLRLPGDL
jgi:hypothetical protein